MGRPDEQKEGVIRHRPYNGHQTLSNDKSDKGISVVYKKISYYRVRFLCRKASTVEKEMTPSIGRKRRENM